MKQLSQKAKIQFTKWIKQRDGPNCFYCRKEYPNVLEHLDDNRNHNTLENFVLSHQTCNVAKNHNLDYQIMAQDKLKQNELAPFIQLQQRLKLVKTVLILQNNTYQKKF